MVGVSWEQTISWLVVLLVLYALVSGRIRFDAAAFGGLIILGMLGISPPQQLFLGFANPALFTLAVVLIMSEAIVQSGILTGFGQAIARGFNEPSRQILALSIAVGIISTLMNNIGAMGLILPTARRMAARAGINRAAYGMPLVYACILGGSITLIGTSSNIIVSTFRQQAIGEPFRMFDFSAHGIAMAGMGILLWLICRSCVCKLPAKQGDERSAFQPRAQTEAEPDPSGPPRSQKNTLIVITAMTPVLILTAGGWLHPAIGFGGVALVMLGAGILGYHQAYEAVNLPLIIFIGSMLSLTNILQTNGALDLLIAPLHRTLGALSPFPLIVVFIAATAFLANILDNSVAAVLMAPTAILLYQSGTMNVHLDALLMAVAAGASLGIVVPSHQATILAMSATGFSRQSFIKTGMVLAGLAMFAASVVIIQVWN